MPKKQSESEKPVHPNFNASAETSEVSTNLFDYNNIDIQKVLSNTPEPSLTKNTSDASMASPQQVNNIIISLIGKMKISKNANNFNLTFVTVAHACQRGATSPKYPDSAMVTDYGIELKISDLRKSCSENGTTVRKLARTIRDQIIEVAKKHNLEGNLSKRYKLDNPDYDEQHLIWVSDFNTFSENPAMPQEVRLWLLDNFNQRFTKK